MTLIQRIKLTIYKKYFIHSLKKRTLAFLQKTKTNMNIKDAISKIDFSSIFSFLGSSLKSLVSKLTFKDVVIIALVCFGLYYYVSAKSYQAKADRVTLVYNDSISKYKNKLKQEYDAKSAYIQTISDLQNNNFDLYTEVKNLKDNPLVVTKTNTVIERDTVLMKSDIAEDLPGVSHKITWGFEEKYDKNNYFSLDGWSVVKNDFSSSSSYLGKVKIGADLTLDLVESKDKTHFQILTRSNNPYLKFTDIQGAVVDPSKIKSVTKATAKPKAFSLGVYGGYGIDSTVKGSLNSGFQIGVGIMWSPSFLHF